MGFEYEGLGGLDIFQLNINWNKPPIMSFYPFRKIQKFTATAETIESVMNIIPMSFTIPVLIDTKEKEAAVIVFFDQMKGRLGRFWIKDPVSHIELYETINATDATFKIKNTGFADNFQATERIWLTSTDGTKDCVKWIQDVDASDPDFIELTTVTPFVDTWTLNDHGFDMGLLRLVRFDTDELTINYSTDFTGVLDLKFKELVYEYPEIL